MGQKYSINTKYLKAFHRNCGKPGNVLPPLKRGRKQGRDSVSNKRIMWWCNIQVCSCNVWAWAPKQDSGVSLMFPAFASQNQSLKTCLMSQSCLVLQTNIPSNCFSTDKASKHTLRGQSLHRVIRKPFYMVTCFGHMRSGLWTSASSLPERCVATALHGFLSYTWVLWVKTPW